MLGFDDSGLLMSRLPSTLLVRGVVPRRPLAGLRVGPWQLLAIDGGARTKQILLRAKLVELPGGDAGTAAAAEACVPSFPYTYFIRTS